MHQFYVHNSQESTVVISSIKPSLTNVMSGPKPKLCGTTPLLTCVSKPKSSNDHGNLLTRRNPNTSLIR